MLTPHHLLFHYYYFFNSVPSGPKILATAMGSWSTGAVSSVLGAVTWRNALGSRENLNCECVWAEPSESAEQISPQFAPQPALLWCGRSSGKTLSLTSSRDEPTSSPSYILSAHRSLSVTFEHCPSAAGWMLTSSQLYLFPNLLMPVMLETIILSFFSISTEVWFFFPKAVQRDDVIYVYTVKWWPPSIN